MNKIEWQKVRNKFEEEMAEKLNGLPGHRNVPPELIEYRSIISHEIPETASKEIFHKAIQVLLKGEGSNSDKLRNEYLSPELEKEKRTLKSRGDLYMKIHASAKKWVESNLSEQELKRQWKKHMTWLPRRYTIYKNPNISFQTIAVDTLARYYLISSNAKIQL